jgi:hypothetical protein
MAKSCLNAQEVPKNLASPMQIRIVDFATLTGFDLTEWDRSGFGRITARNRTLTFGAC